MEASILSAAVTVILRIVGNKLGPLVTKEYSSIVGVRKDLEDLKNLALNINDILETPGDHRAKRDVPWLRLLKEVVHDVDDVVDEFQLKAEKHDADGQFVSRYLHRKIDSFILQSKSAKKIKKIKKTFSDIVKLRNDLTTICDHDPARHTNNIAMDMQTLPIVDEASVLGRDQEKYEIISKLVDTSDQQKIKIISIIGIGGSGKTTLAKLVFNDRNTIENHFDVRLWVHVSQELNYGIIKKLYQAFADNDPGEHSLPYMSRRIQEGLTEKKFLIVMDDIWTESLDQWDQIMGYLKLGAHGSRILLTTRSQNVAIQLICTYQLCLPRLSPDYSWQLFQLTFGEGVMELDDEYLQVGKEIVGRCHGVPLAIKVLASSLRDKDLIGEWEAMRENSLLDVEGEESLLACLRLSYFHLPSHLKHCFTLCSLFPKGYLINKQQLIDIWIAHDMISLDPGVNYLEHIGCRYFNSLVQANLLQDVEERYDGTVTCKMHDLIHDLARAILSGLISGDATDSAKGYRYFSLIKQPGGLFSRNLFDNARAIYVDKANDIIFGKELKNAKHLRSIIVGSTGTSRAVVSTILQTENLSYLHIAGLRCETLPDAISHIWRLEALHLPDSDLLKLPESIGNLQKLRTLNMSWCTRLKNLPDSIGDCLMISTIDLSFCHELTSLPNSVSRNKNLRVLRLCDTGIMELMSSITTLENLEYLDLHFCNYLSKLPEGIGNLRKLKVLNLQGCRQLGSIPEGIHQLVQLQMLGLFVLREGAACVKLSDLKNLSKIGGDLTINGIEHVTEPSEAYMACLKQKTNLQQLSLVWGRSDTTYVEKEAVVLNGLEPPSGIKTLKIERYPGRQYTEWMMKKRVGVSVDGPQFPCLTNMKLSDFPKLKHLEGLVELPCLKYLDLADMPVLESISGGPFPSLVKLHMWELPKLKEVWIVTAERTLTCMEERGGYNNHASNLGQVQIGICLSELQISRCPALKVKPHLPLSLEEFHLYMSNEQLLRVTGQDQASSSDACLTPSLSHLTRLILSRVETAGSSAGSASRYSWDWDLLPYMSALTYVEIRQCYGLVQLPESILSLTSLQFLKIEQCSSFCKLPEWLGRLQSLNEVIIRDCRCLRNLPTSMQDLTTLQRLDLYGCTSLMLPQWIGRLQSLRYLATNACEGSIPVSLGQLTLLEEIKIVGCALRVCPCNAPHQLLEYLGELTSLRVLELGKLNSLTCLPESMCHLTSLESLKLEELHALQQLPQSLGDLSSLRELWLARLPGLTSLPQSICRLTSLENICLFGCPGIKTLPEGIRKHLTNLQELYISGCRDLGRRCKGKDRHLIFHISHVRIDGQEVAGSTSSSKCRACSCYI